MAGPPALLVLLLVVAAAAESGRTTATPDGCAAPADSGSTLRVLHAFGPCSPFHSPSASWEDTILDLLSRDDSRFLYLASLATARRSFVPIASGRQLLQTPTYIVRARLGSPPQSLLLAVDTSSDVAWLPCSGCAGCSPSSDAPPFDTSRSTTYRPVPCGSQPCSQVPNPTCPAGAKACGFNLTYGSSSLLAVLSQDSLSLATDVVPGYTFGCLQKAAGPAVPPHGLLGLGRGPLSFISQTKNLYASTFSYCLPSFKSLNFSGTLRLGPAGQPKSIKTTPLRSSPRRSSLYFVDLVGIRVGRKVVDIPPAAIAFDASTGAGTIFDSGTMFTRLVAPAYAAVRDEFRRRVRGAGDVTSLGGFDTCYAGPINPPAITFLFAGMNVTLPADNYLIHSTAGSLTCLAMAAAPDNVNSVLNVIASMQQMNHRVYFDVANGRLGVARELCTV
ncbi:aspartyl protease AED3 [Elaeis guineensis]|uniref:Aspartyl protease AED3-like n=1 Tax=Elaeis guineensis var. tenera TaxID=51953 RepID=A0A6I9RR06_ELAGV|nr:aspartyl protease AED3-like [Elaeis guineensis]